MSATALTVTGTVIISGSEIVVGTVQISGSSTGSGASGVSGIIVWLGPNQVPQTVTGQVQVDPTSPVLVSVSALPIATMTNVGPTIAGASTALAVMPKYAAGIPFVAVVSSTVVIQSYTTYLFTAYVGTNAPIAGTGQFQIPAGQVLRIQNIQAQVTNPAVAGGSVMFMPIAVSTTTSALSAAVATQPHPMVLMMVGASGTVASILGGQADIPATSTLVIGIQASTSCSVGWVVVQGYLF